MTSEFFDSITEGEKGAFRSSCNRLTEAYQSLLECAKLPKEKKGERFEERLRRPMGSPMETRFGAGAENIFDKQRSMQFSIDAEMIVFGKAENDAYVTMGGEPVQLGADGTFTVRVPLPDKRQVIPLVAGRSDGVEQQTIVLAIERNTKVMEPVIREPGA